MNTNFSGLDEASTLALTDAVPLVTILIAGADGEIDATETGWAEKLTQIRQYDFPEMMNQYYQEVGKNYSTRVNALIEELPGDIDRRTDAITEKLSALNDILSGMDSDFAISLVESLRSFAKHVAQSSGGFLGFASVSKEEADLIGLSMLKEIKDINHC